MADENEDGTKTEDPSQKRLDEAVNRGDVVKSHEVNTWFIIAGGTIVLFAFARSMSGDLQTALRGVIANSHRLPTDGRDLIALAALLGLRVFGILAGPFVVLMLAAVAGSMIQHRLVWSNRCAPRSRRSRRWRASSGCSPNRPPSTLPKGLSS